MQYVTYDNLFKLVEVILAVISLVFTITYYFKHKK